MAATGPPWQWTRIESQYGIQTEPCRPAKTRGAGRREEKVGPNTCAGGEGCIGREEPGDIDASVSQDCKHRGQIFREQRARSVGSKCERPGLHSQAKRQVRIEIREHAGGGRQGVRRYRPGPFRYPAPGQCGLTPTAADCEVTRGIPPTSAVSAPRRRFPCARAQRVNAPRRVLRDVSNEWCFGTRPRGVEPEQRRFSQT